MDKKTSAVQEIIQSFPKYENEDDEKVHVSGARAVWSYEVYQKKPGSVQNDSVPAFEELGLSDATLSIVRKNVCEGVEKLAGRNPFRVWISDILNPQLNNAVRTHPESSPWILQVLFFGEEHIAFILTLFPVDALASEEQTAAMIGFSRTTARLLMASLMNFCHTEFFLVPTALAYIEKFDVERLQRDLEQQMSSASEFYGGPAKLSKTAYHELIQAMNRVMRSTSVPCALQLSPAQKPEDWLLLMDADWHKAVVHLLNMLEGTIKQKITEPCHLTYEPKNRTKTMITVFEIARRLSFQHKVLVVSRDEELRVPIEKIAAELKRNHGLELWLTFESQQPFRARTHELEDIVIAWDAPELRTHSKVALSVTEVPSSSRLYSTLPERQTVQLTQPIEMDTPTGTVLEPSLFKDGQCRMILIGKTGHGKSSTGNTILGRLAFKTQVGINSGTMEGDLQSTTMGEIEIQVMDTPGLHDTEVKNDVISQRITQSLMAMHPGPHAIILCLSCDQRFTQEEVKVYEALKDIFGENMTNYLIVVMTRRDELEAKKQCFENQLARCTELRKVLEEAGNRYVLFDNRETLSKDTKREQVEQLLAKVQEVVVLNAGDYFKHNLTCMLNESMIRMRKAAADSETGQPSKPQPKARDFGAKGESRNKPTLPEWEGSTDTQTSTLLQSVMVFKEMMPVAERRAQFEFKAKSPEPTRKEISSKFQRKPREDAAQSHRAPLPAVRRPRLSSQAKKRDTPVEGFPETGDRSMQIRSDIGMLHRDLSQFKEFDLQAFSEDSRPPPEKPPRSHLRSPPGQKNDLEDVFQRFGFSTAFPKGEDDSIAHEVPDRPRMRFSLKNRMVEERLKHKIIRGGADLNQEQLRELEMTSKSLGQKIREGMAKFKVEKLDKCSVM